MPYIEHLRSQVDRCFRTALACPDAEFAAELTTIALELRQEASQLEAAAKRELHCKAAATPATLAVAP